MVQDTIPRLGAMSNPYQSITSSQGIPMPHYNSFTWVQGEDFALNYPVAPGNTVVIFDNMKPWEYMYVKETDNTGRALPTRKFRLIDESAPDPNQVVPNIDLTNYVTTEQLTNELNNLPFNNRLEALEQLMSEAVTQIESLRNELEEDDEYEDVEEDYIEEPVNVNREHRRRKKHGRSRA